MRKTAKQSSQAGNGQSFPANKAVNGDLNDFTHTDSSLTGDDWWRVDLGRAYILDRIVVYNRENLCKNIF